MKLDITPILRNSGARKEFSFEEPLEMLSEGIGSVAFEGHVHLDGMVRNFNGMMELEAVARVHYITQCDRCCESIEGDLTVNIREDMVELTEKDATTTEGEEEERYVFKGHELELDTIAAEALLLEAPVYMLCSDGCKGLCAECGTNLNRKACDCGSNRPVDFRLEALKRFSDPDGQ